MANDRIQVDKFLRATSSVLRDTLSSLAADLDVHPSKILVGYTYDDTERAHGWRVQVTLDKTLAYAFDTELLVAIEKLVDGYKRIQRGESVVDENLSDETTVH